MSIQTKKAFNKNLQMGDENFDREWVLDVVEDVLNEEGYEGFI